MTVQPMLTAEELERYARHIVLREVGGPGQAALKRARVLVIGAGGLGAPLLMYLAAAGVGTLGVIDDDVVSLSNLQRQIIHGTRRRRRAEGGRAPPPRSGGSIRMSTVETHAARLTAANALDLVSRYDLVADGSDNFSTRYLVSDACFLAKKPLVTATLGTFDGTLTTIRAHERGADGKPNPTYRCLFPDTAAAGLDTGLRGGRHPRRAHRRARLDDGARGHPRDRRLRPRAGRAASDGRCARDCASRR